MLSAAREVAWTVPLTSRDGHQREGEQHKEVPFGGRARHHYAGAAASSKLSQLGAHMTERDNKRKLKAWAKMKYIEDQKNYHCMYAKSTRYDPEKEEYIKGVFSPNPAFFQDLAQLLPYELTHVRASPRDCADGLAQAARKI